MHGKAAINAKCAKRTKSLNIKAIHQLQKTQHTKSAEHANHRRLLVAPVGALKLAKSHRIPMLPSVYASTGKSSITLFREERTQQFGQLDIQCKMHMKITLWMESCLLLHVYVPSHTYNEPPPKCVLANHSSGRTSTQLALTAPR